MRAAHRRARGLLPQPPEVRGEEKEEMKQEKRVQSRSGREVTPVEELPQTEVESWEGTGTEKGRRGWSEAAMGPRGWFLSSLQDNHGHSWTHPHIQHFPPDVTSLSASRLPIAILLPTAVSLLQRGILSYHPLLENRDIHNTDNSASTWDSPPPS